MKHRMTVRADRTQVLNWINLVCRSDLGELAEMMDMDKPGSNRTVNALKIKSANLTAGTIVPNA